MAKTHKSQKIVNFKSYLPQNRHIREKQTQSATVIQFPVRKPFDRLYAELLPRDQKFLDDLLEVFSGDHDAVMGLWERMEEGI